MSCLLCKRKITLTDTPSSVTLREKDGKGAIKEFVCGSPSCKNDLMKIMEGQKKERKERNFLKLMGSDKTNLSSLQKDLLNDKDNPK